MIGRVDRLVPQSPIGPVSTVVMVLFVFSTTMYFFWVAIVWTVRRSQRTKGVVGNIARCCGRRGWQTCKAVNVEEEEEKQQGEDVVRTIQRRSRGSVGRSGTIKGSLR